MALIDGTYTSLAQSLPRVSTEGVALPTTRAPEGPNFSDRLRELFDEVNAREAHATQAAEQFASGDRNDIHGTMIALEQADISFRFVSNVRSRLVEAYREVMRMGG
jgi:flagellar hook-basal body complex protein FliE